MPRGNPGVHVGTYISPANNQLVEALSRERSVSKSQVIRELVEKGLEKHAQLSKAEPKLEQKRLYG